MATLEGELRLALIANGGVSALVGTRVYESIKPLNTDLPAIVYLRVTSGPDELSYHLQGTALLRADITLSALAATNQAARTLAEAVKTQLQDFHGALTASQRVEIALLRDFRDMGFDPEIAAHRWDVDVEFIFQ